jgi:hypothetical protein
MELVRDSLERTNREQQRPFYPVRLTVIVSSDEWKPGTKPAVLCEERLQVLEAAQFNRT